MTEKLDSETFDIVDVIAGRSFPETEVAIYFDEALAFAVGQYQDKLTRLRGKEYDRAVDELEALLADLNGQKYLFTVRGVPLKVQQDIVKKTRAKYEPQKKSGKTPDANDVTEEMIAHLWAAYIVKITSPDGRVQVPSPKSISAFRGGAPAHAVAAIDAAIEELSTGAKSGFERAAQDVDFLSGASPEA